MVGAGAVEGAGWEEAALKCGRELTVLQDESGWWEGTEGLDFDFQVLRTCP